MKLNRYKWTFEVTLAALIAVMLLAALIIPSGKSKGGKMKGWIYWNVAQGLDHIGSKKAAKEIKFESMCASMGWERLHYSCRDEKDASRLNSEIWEFFNNTKLLPPDYHAEAWGTGDPAKLNVVVSNSARDLLERHLRSKGFIPD